MAQKSTADYADMRGPRKWLASRFEHQQRRVIGYCFTLAALLLLFGNPGRTGLRVIGTLPADGSTDVPVSTGIEITFSRADLGNPEFYFSIEPSVSGRFETHKDTVVFVPAQLHPATTYRVTIQKGFGVLWGGPGLADDVAISFTTTAVKQATIRRIVVDDGPFEFPTKDPPVIAVEGFDSVVGVEVAASVYRYPNANRYLSAIRLFGPSDGDLDGLAKVADFTTKVRQLLPGGAYLMFPEAPPAGYYVASFTDLNSVSAAPQFVRFQVTDISYYASVTSTKTLVWLNDLASGGPVRGGRLRLGDSVVQADASGVAVIPTGPVPGRSAGVVGLEGVGAAEDGREVAISVVSKLDASLRSPTRPELYWRYVYVDRPVYGPSETVSFWGVLKPREQGARRIDQLAIQLSSSERSDLGKTLVPVVNGLFSGSIALPNLRPGYYSLAAMAGDSVMLSSALWVDTYTKPTYTLGLAADRRAAFAGDDVIFTAHARFFDGTPVVGLRLRADYVPGVDVITTDAKGDATFRVRAGAYDLRVNVVAAQTELAEMSASASVDVFHSSVDVEASSTLSGTAVDLRLKALKLSLERLNGATPCCQDRAPLRTPLGEQTIRGRLVREDYQRTDAGELYDYISKQVVKQYEYKHVESVVDTFNVVTNPTGEADYRLTVETEVHYRVELRSTDDKGRESSTSHYIYATEGAGSAASIGMSASLAHSSGRLALGSRANWKVGELVEAEFRLNDLDGKIAPARPNGFLFYTLRLGLDRFQVQSDPVYRAPFREEEIPNTSLSGVYFDGRRYFAAHTVLRFDKVARALTLKITPDQVEYRPGETVQLRLEATDAAGRPAAATVNINIVDEALYAVRSDDVDLLGTLYSEGDVPADEIAKHFSHYRLDFSCGCGATGGGGVGGHPREAFQDAVIFRMIATDAAGKATTTFRLPDNLTTWRVTYQAVTAQLDATSGTLALPATLPFFVDVLASESYRVGDAPAIVARTFGDKLKDGDDVTIGVDLTGPAPLTTNISARAFEARPIVLPALPVGDYTLTITAAGPRGLRDAVRRTIHVQPSFLRREAVDFRLVFSGLHVTGATAGLTTLQLADYDRATLIAALQRMRWEWGDRVEQQVARSLGAQWLHDVYGQRSSAPAQFDLRRYEVPNESHAIAVLPYPSADLELSAKIADLMPNQVDPDLAKYFTDRLAVEMAAVGHGDSGARRRAIAALYGLAALGKPDRDAIEAYAERWDLTVMERLYLGHALALSGDAAGARLLLDSVLASAEHVGADLRLSVGRDNDELLTATALGAALAARLGLPEAAPLLRYASANRPSETLTFVEQLLAIRALSAQIQPGRVAVTYTVSGLEKTREIEPNEVFTLDLLPEELATLSFSSTRGRVGLTLSYDAPLRLNPNETKAGFGVTRTYAWRGDLLAITLHPTFPATAPAGAYEIVDVLPAGIHAVLRPWVYDQARDKNIATPMQAEGQRMSFYAYPGMPDIVYFGRKVNGGTFSAEPAVLEQMESGGIWAWSAPISLQIACLSAVEFCAVSEPILQPIVLDPGFQALLLLGLYILAFVLVIILGSVARRTPLRNGFGAFGRSHWILFIALVVAGTDEFTVAHNSAALFLVVGAGYAWAMATRASYKLDRQSWAALPLPVFGHFFVMWRRSNKIWKDPSLATTVPERPVVARTRRSDAKALRGIVWLFAVTQLISGLLTNPPQLVFGLVLVVGLTRRRIRYFNSSRRAVVIVAWLVLIAIGVFALAAALHNGPCGGLVGC